jgi:DNA-3-methyladenine glycosylase
MSLKKLPQSFYRQDAIALAKALIGKILVHKTADQTYRARIVETEAYCGPEDLASHSSKGLTARTKVMFGPAGRAYVFLIYGIHDMFNIVAGEKEGDAQAVLIRAAEPLDHWQADLAGPGKLAKAMKIKRADDGLSLTGSKLFLLDSPDDRPTLITTTRIGVDYARHWKDAPLRFYDAASSAVSRFATAAPKPNRSPEIRRRPGKKPMKD